MSPRFLFLTTCLNCRTAKTIPTTTLVAAITVEIVAISNLSTSKAILLGVYNKTDNERVLWRRQVLSPLENTLNLKIHALLFSSLREGKSPTFTTKN
jgi:hypothetical protein